MYIAAVVVSLSLSYAAEPASKGKKPDDAEATFEKAMKGVHLCGDHWNGYNEVCTITRVGKELHLKSEGPSGVMNGRLEVVTPDEVVLHGTLYVSMVPLGNDGNRDFACEPDGPYRFKRTGKRRYFRHVRTCEDMTTIYFDLFTAQLSKEAQQKRTRKLSDLKGNMHLLWPDHLDDDSRCRKVNDVFLRSSLAGAKRGTDIPCQRVNQTDFGRAGLYSCDIGHPVEQESLSHEIDARLLVFDKPKHCDDAIAHMKFRRGG